MRSKEVSGNKRENERCKVVWQEQDGDKAVCRDREDAHGSGDGQVFGRTWDFAARQRIFGPPETRDAVMARIQENDALYAEYRRLLPRLQRELVLFCMGVRGVNITYDRVFKSVFDPELHPERLEDFLKQCLKRDLKILLILPNESKRLTQDGTLLVMDIIVQLETGEIVNVEIQRIGYLFPGQRCACYSSDMVMRQYSKVRAERNEDGKPFSYRDIKTVYTIVLMQQSSKEFKELPDQYLHYGKQAFDTGLELDMVQEYLLIALDNFMEIHHNIDNKLDAWLYLIASDDPEDILQVVKAYPEFEDIYRQVFDFRYHMEELMGVFSEALSILDRNTVQYMIDQQREELQALVSEKETLVAERDSLAAEVEAKTAEVEAKDAKLETQAAEIARLKALLGQSNKQSNK